MSRRAWRSGAALLPSVLLWLMAGCQSVPASRVAAPPNSPQAQLLLKAQESYDAGDYQRTIDTLRELPRRDAADSATVTGLKLLAFSYCLTGQTPVCQDTFVRLLKLDRRYQLSPAERGHPSWGWAFAVAQRQVGI